MRVLSNVRPTGEQLVILTDTSAGFRLIRGAAGSGKTTTAAMRLRQLCAARIARKRRLSLPGSIRVMVLTFNRTLRGYVEHLVEEQAQPQDDLEVTIETFSRWARNLCNSPRDILNGRPLIKSLLQKSGITADLRYFVDEVEYILGRFPPNDRDRYIDAERTGRGRAPAVTKTTRSKILNDVIVPYERAKERNGQVDWNDIALRAAMAPNQHYDVVIVDETQDLSANQVRAILKHLDRNHTTTFIMDAVQRIYPQAFRWNELGVTIRPEMVFTLKENHRNTEEIARLAASLVRDLPREENGVFPDPLACKLRGPRPELTVGTFSAQLKYMLKRVQPRLAAGDTVAILHPLGGGWFDYTRTVLRDHNIAYCELTRQSEWPAGSEQVALSTMHSAKGLEFDHVLLPGLNREVTPHGSEERHGTLDSLRRLVAMSICRSRNTVMVGFKPGEQSTLIDLVDPATYDLIEVD